jgi:hypothetical protein
MKEWEKQIAATKKLGNTYVVVTDEFAYLCEKIKGKYFVKSGDNLEVKDYKEVIKV